MATDEQQPATDKPVSETTAKRKGRHILTGPGPGRPKGMRNRTSQKAIDDILDAYEEKGGVAWLVKLEDKIFAQLFARVVPQTNNLNITGGLTIQISNGHLDAGGGNG